MVIQRWQSVWLLVAAICVAVFSFLPVAVIGVEDVVDTASREIMISPSDNYVVMIVGLLTALLLVINILSFKDTRRQKRMTILSILLMVVLAVCAVLMVYGNASAGGQIQWMGSNILLLGAVAFAVLAYRGISHDEKLLKAADRIR